MNRRLFFLASGALLTASVGYFVGQATNLPAVREASPGAPLIGIASLTSETYIRAIRQAGGIPIVLPLGDGSEEQIDAYLRLVDGLLMPGGADIKPSEWGEEQHPMTKLLDENRYLFEKSLVTRWIQETRKPLLGICLGSQWINVAHGGSLVQDIPSEFNVNHRDVTHPVELEPDSRLRAIYGEDSFEVNSLHHQAVRKAGNGLRIAARCPDGVIEATECTDPERFIIGVQWHPEKMIEQDPRQVKIFDAFVTAVAECKARNAKSDE